MFLITSLLAVLGAGVGGVLWMKGRRGSETVLPDAGVSTLVFPPESKFQASVLPPH